MIAAADVFPGSAGHDIRVDINRINGIGYGNFDVAGKQLLNIGSIAFGTVGNEDFIGSDLAAAGAVIVFGNRFTQKFVTGFGTVSFKRRFSGHFIRRFVQRFDANRRKRTSDVADSHTDHFFFGMSCRKRRNSLCNIDKQIRRFQF